MDRAVRFAGGDPAQLGRRRVVLVARRRGRRRRSTPDGPRFRPGERPARPPRRPRRPRTRSKRLRRPRTAAIRSPSGCHASSAEVGVVAGDLAVVVALAADGMDLVAAGALGDVGDRRAVGRPGGAGVGHAGRAGERADAAGDDVDDADLRALEVVARDEDVRDLRAVGGDGRVLLVAERVEVLVVAGEPPRPRVGDVHDGHAGRAHGLDLVLDRDEQARVVEPDRGRRPRRAGAARRRSTGTSQTSPPWPYATVVPSGERRGCVSSQYGIDLAPGGEPLGGRAVRSEVERRGGRRCRGPR